MEAFFQDVRYAFRSMRRSPGFSVAAIVTLALGMGATTAIFSVVRAVLLSPLPYSQPERRVMIWSRWVDFDKTWVADAEVYDYRRMCPSLQSVAAWDSGRANLSDGGDPVRIGIASVTANTFETLGARPLAGRGFTAEEDLPGGAPVVVLSGTLWQSRYGADPAMLGRVVRLDGISRRVVGIMPKGFALPTDFTVDAAEPGQAWIPLQIDPKQISHDGHNFYAAAKLASGATAARATAELKTVTANLTRQGVYRAPMRFEAFAVPVEEEIRGGARRSLLLVFGAVGFLMVMACANVANLLLARAEGRQREISVRAAIGAGKGRLVRQLLTESLVLAGGGAVLGLALAAAGVRVIAARGSAGLPALSRIGIEPGMLFFTAVLTGVTTLLFGLAPALRTLRFDLNESLRDGAATGGSGGVRGHRLRRSLAGAQMGFAVLLLLGAGLMARTIEAMTRIDLGFDPAHVLTVRLRPDEVGYPKPDHVVGLYRTVLERVRELPGVRAAGIVRALPLASSIGTRGLTVEGYVPPPGTNARGDWQVVSDGAVEALGEKIVRGRSFTAADSESGAPVALVNETFARTYWPGGDPVGKRLRMGSAVSARPWMTIVGVMKDVRHNGLTAAIKEKFYVPHAQFALSAGTAPRDMTLVVRTDGDPLALAAPIRDAVKRIDRGLPVADVRSMSAVVGASMSSPRLTASLLSIFAALALVLAAVGISGVLSYLVSRRRREIGIRMALGATRRSVLTLILRGGLGWAGTGIGAGLIAAFFLTRLMSGLLYGVAPHDPRTFAAVTVVLLAIAAAASAIPAFRAARVNPLEALRTD
ncbi:MAG TPA: ABC transporter permease [Thermoanaerobaculia bacterium]|nr:ABC transporter permease [Thermoanaerobaculia bacterium]